MQKDGDEKVYVDFCSLASQRARTRAGDRFETRVNWRREMAPHLLVVNENEERQADADYGQNYSDHLHNSIDRQYLFGML